MTDISSPSSSYSPPISAAASSTTQSPAPSGAFPPPPGYVVDLDNPADYLHTINIVGISICLVFIVVSFTLRCYAKFRIKTPSLAEDYMCIISFFLIAFYIFLCYMMARHGEGYHAWEVTPENYKLILKWLYASSILWIPAAFAVKTNILLLTARVFAVYERVALFIHIYVGFMAFAYLPIQFVKIFICTPISHYWDPVPHGRCLDQPKVFLTDTAIAIITDFLILVIPIPLIWRLSMPLRRKLKIVAMLGAGGAAVAVACYREYKIYVFQNTTDVTGDFVVMNLCGTIELTIGFVCACLPAINLLVESHLRSRPSSNRPRTRMWLPRKEKYAEQSTTCYTMTALSSSAYVGEGPSGMQAALATGGAGTGKEPGTLGPSTSDLHPSVLDLRGTHSLDLHRVSSTDGRAEGWLVPNNPPAETGRGDLHKETWVSGPPRAAVLMARLRMDPREILVPDRIWDGTCRGYVSEEGGDEEKEEV